MFTDISFIDHWQYLFLNVLGFLVIMGLGCYSARKNNFTWFRALVYTAGIPVVFLIGTRLAYLFFYADINNPAVHFLDPKLYGFSLYGGLILVVLYSCIIALFSRIPVWSWLDYHTLGLMGYVSLGKTGCFMNGCCFGIPTLVPWGISYAPGSQAYNYYIVQAFSHTASHSWSVYSDRIHPVQLYESLLMAGFALVYAVQLWLGSDFWKINGFYLAVGFYAAQRFLLEIWKPYEAVFGGLTLFQILSLVLLSYAITMLVTQDREPS